VPARRTLVCPAGLLAAVLLAAVSPLAMIALLATASPLASAHPLAVRVLVAAGQVSDGGGGSHAGRQVAAPASVPGPAPAPSGAIVLIGVSGLSWSAVDVVRTPVLAGLADSSSRLVAVGSVSVRSAQTPTCPVDGWLTLSAGARAAGPPWSGSRCPAFPALLAGRAPPSAARRAGGQLVVAASPRRPGRAPGDPVAIHVAGWAGLRSSNLAGAYRSAPGLLGAALTGDGGCVGSVGPGAALAAARADGTVDRWSPLSALGAGVLDECRVTVVDAGNGPAAAERAWAIVARAAPAGTTVLLAAVADGPVGTRPTPQLGLLALRGPAASAVAPVPAGGRPSGRPVSAGTGGSVTSTSTDWPGVVTLTDLTATLLAAGTITAGTAPGGTVPGGTAPVGAVLTRVGGHPGLAGLRATAVRARVAGAAVPGWFTVSGVGVLGLISGQLLLRRGSRAARAPHRLQSRVLQVLALTVLALPVATRLASLVPWWAAGGTGLRGPAVALWAAQAGWAVAVACAATALGALLGRSTPPPTPPIPPVAGDLRRSRGLAVQTVAVLAVLVLSAVVTVVDLVTGSPLSHLAVVGLLPVDGSRFHGLGNEIVAATDAAILLGASAAAGPLLLRGRTRWAVAVVVAAGSAFAVLDGSPALGADFGGVPATVAGTAVTALAVAGVRLHRRGVVMVAVLAAGSGLVGALLDATHPAARRTHLGAFMVAALHGGGAAVLERKALSVLGPFVGFAGTFAAVGSWCGLVLTAVLAVLVLRPGSGVLAELSGRWPAWRAGVAGAAVAGAVGAALNDSGVVVLLVVCGATVAAVTAASAAP